VRTSATDLRQQPGIMRANASSTPPGREHSGAMRLPAAPSQNASTAAAQGSTTDPGVRTSATDLRQPSTMRAAMPSGREHSGAMLLPSRPAQNAATGADRATDLRTTDPGMPYSDPALREPANREHSAARAPGGARLPTNTGGPPDPREHTGTTRSPLTITQPLGSGHREQTGVIRTAGASMPAVGREQTGAFSADATTHDQTGVIRAARAAMQSPASREQSGSFSTDAPTRDQTGVLHAMRAATQSPAGREQSGAFGVDATTRDHTGLFSADATTRDQTGVLRAARRTTTDPSFPTISRTMSGPLPPIPEHLRNRLQYVALTAEMTGGGIDARREDGISRLVLWRDVVGVVARRMPPVYDGAAFVDIVSTAGSTLRIVAWTRLTGDLVEADADARPRAVVEHVVARCPTARLDPATRQFLDSGEPAQLPDLDTLRAHDARLA
jgi:hypothetical protein